VFAGSTYKLKVRAHNIHGWGEWSEVGRVLATGVPDEPDPPITVINNKFVRITWTDPAANFEAIDSYRVLVVHSDGVTFTEELTYCDASDPVTFERQYCEIPLALLESTDYSFQLSAGQLIKAKVAARNLNGWGEFSQESIIAANFETTPSKMAAPTRNAATTTGKLVVDWVPLVSPDTGYSDITSYNLQWDKGTDGATWVNLIGFNTASLAETYTIAASLNEGDHYQLKVRANNFWGWGEFSDPLTIKTATWPY